MKRRTGTRDEINLAGLVPEIQARFELPEDATAGDVLALGVELGRLPARLLGDLFLRCLWKATQA